MQIPAYMVQLHYEQIVFIFVPFHTYTANVYKALQGLCGGFLQYLQGKPCNIYKLQGNIIVIIGFSLQILQKKTLITL